MSDKWAKRTIPCVPEDWNKNQENDFNKWLSENLNCLKNNLIDIESEIICIDTEATNNDNNRLDILASYNTSDGTEEYIAIESQVTKADLDHLSRLLMYMATIDQNPKIDKKPIIGIWIVHSIDPSVEETINWINNNFINYDLYVLKPITIDIDTTKHPSINIKIQGVHFETLVKPNRKEKTQSVEKEKKRRRANFKFSEMEIPPEAELIYKQDNNIKCTVINEVNQVSYNGKEYTLSGLTNELKEKSTGYGIMPLEWWYHKGTLLSKIRDEKDSY